MLVGALVGTVTKDTAISDVNLVLYIAMIVFALAFIILSFTPISDPEMGKTTQGTVFEHSPWAFRHCTLGVIGIFVYVGIEIGIPGTLNFYISDMSDKGAGVLGDAAAIGGFVAGTYWLLMLVGRFVAGFIADKVSSRAMMVTVTTLAIVLILISMISSFSAKEKSTVIPKSIYEEVEPSSERLIINASPADKVLFPSESDGLVTV